MTTPEKLREYMKDVQINVHNAAVLADALVRREDDKKYNLVSFLKETMEYAK